MISLKLPEIHLLGVDSFFRQFKTLHHSEPQESQHMILPTTAAYVNTAGTPLNVRSAPNGRIIGTVANGTIVNAANNAVTAGGYHWVEIAPSRWVAAEFLVRAFNEATVHTNGTPLNVRSTPNGRLVDALPDETPVYVFSNAIKAGSYAWVQIGPNRWVAEEFLDYIMSIATV